ncbi:MAG: hypothetical protein MJ095_02255 [Oscillospiraceae bacterium]|nr:hypothetical protein [Oscillospiraceae bacterium]
MRNWYDESCGCNDSKGNAIIGIIINGTKYREDAVQQAQYEKDMAAVNQAISEIKSAQSECTKSISSVEIKHESDISAIENQISTLSKSVAAINSTVSSIDERVRKIEEKGVQIKITSFKAAPVVALAGSEVDVKLTWALNTQATSLTINGLAAAGTSFTTKANASKTFTLVATDKDGNADTASAKIDFMNHIVYGASSDSAPTSDMLSSLDTKLLSEEIAHTINVNCGSGAYIYYAYPKRLGKVKFYSYGMFEGGFEDPVVIAYKNSAGYMEEYNVYRSSQKLTQTIEIQTAKEV